MLNEARVPGDVPANPTDATHSVVVPEEWITEGGIPRQMNHVTRHP